jgi:RNA polymerase sigma-70 factor (ECF subfamily)
MPLPGAAMSAESHSTASVYVPATLGRLLDENRRKLLAMLERRIDKGLNARIDAEEVYQEGCIVALRRWLDFESMPGGDAYVWLYGIMRDQLIENWRKQTRGRRDLRREQQMPDRSTDQLGQGLIAAGPGPRTEAELNEFRQKIRNVLELLDEDDFEVIKLRQFEGRSFAVIGEMLRLNENTATVRYVRALKKLKAVWEALYSEES